MAKIDYVNVDKIKEMAKEKGISLKYFCDHFGKYRTYLANIRSGVNKLDETELIFIADALGTTTDYLTDKSEQKEKPEQTEVDTDELIKTILNLPREKKQELFARLAEILKEEPCP